MRLKKLNQGDPAAKASLEALWRSLIDKSEAARRRDVQMVYRDAAKHIAAVLELLYDVSPIRLAHSYLRRAETPDADKD